MSRRRFALLAAALLVVAACGTSSPPASTPPASPSSSPPTARPSPTSPAPTPPVPSPPARVPLAGLTIAIDPGHQLGNRNFTAEINRLVPAGGFDKACNTTGTATDEGWPEATFTFLVAEQVAHRLTALGARVEQTRTTNSERKWGPCIDVRGRFGARVGADLSVSLHADGAPAREYGFHVIAPAAKPTWTDDIAEPSHRLALALRSALLDVGIPRSTYVADGLAVRADLGTLNHSDVPIAMLELGNMRNADDARRMRTAEGRTQYAEGVVRGIRRYLRR